VTGTLLTWAGICAFVAAVYTVADAARPRHWKHDAAVTAALAAILFLIAAFLASTGVVR
jgi:hypothetical protein